MQRTASRDKPSANLARIISAWRSTLRKAETILMTTPSERAEALISRHFAAAAGASMCSRPSSPIAATTNSCASGCKTKDRAAIRSVDISREVRTDLIRSGHSISVGIRFEVEVRDGARVVTLHALGTPIVDEHAWAARESAREFHRNDRRRMPGRSFRHSDPRQRSRGRPRPEERPQGREPPMLARCRGP